MPTIDDDVFDSTQDLARWLNNTASLPAPRAYALLGNLNNAMFFLREGLSSSADALIRSLTLVTVTDSNGDPTDNATAAAAKMRQAAALAAQAGQLLAAAQSDIAGQGYAAP